ncbi:receptor activity-modifying protein 1 isoform X1 [Paralichthys olivaceus]|uniref:receptor activity-modifying protein 1 isoform X1 n=1 Tax=Paralichthys olivaceus TaxID=8255 RepID=UPI003752EC3E
MILYLLCPLLIAGIKSQTVNVTVEERSRAERNQTFNVSTDIFPSENLTDVMSRIENELENNNQTLITEDNESFQDQDMFLPPGRCQKDALVEYGHSICEAKFHKEMLSIGSENWCQLDSISSLYSGLTHCLESLSDITGCFYPNPETQDLFLFVHSRYFQNCTKEELVFEDAPHWVVMVLTLIPVSLIPFLVYLVVWKSKVQE